ncbi:Asp23/Gls24 family envelope stress response protein [Arthrobacter agilis]|uniref:Asp23/Gls24 family envelope stress response protein n=1 Tax=Arthrobacter agilis TaxID=37921 RepID=UPI000B361B8A|nr:Asp23/Gls24 family envelope stress response protein [Arthrobacter agilis]OUM40684.1 hypothetical protein B8W74_14460 [Arthrobacter agilis]PPB45294.1 Asp23/Gls24 family envelope stress response protein [Arthrobacter agilis]TPV28002.1 Asp23/Gls24 family envelope stress response protein [Arthrobacter agilis]VDR31306.1 Protein of uncharacterised function (DUF322) [Arthrobacter agilis]
MSTWTGPAPDSPAPGSPAPDSPLYGGTPHGDPSSRGTLVLKEKVLQKIAGQAAAELPFVGGRSGGVLGLGATGDLDARPQADVDLDGSTAFVSLTVTMLYPTPLRAGTEQLRAHVTETLERTTPVHVGRIDVTIASLETGSAGKGRRLE